MLVFVSNFLNHHQYPVGEHLFNLTGGEYRFVETEPMPDWIKKGGYSEYENLPWLLQTWASQKDKKTAEALVEHADVVIISNNYYTTQIRKRLKAGRLTFNVGERWLKKGFINILSPRLLKSQWLYHTEFYNKPLYHLCASAYAANDLYSLRSFKNKCFKWGYFTETHDLNVEKILETRRSISRIRILAIARFLFWKHHELSVQCVRNLLDKGYDVELDIYGNGLEFEKISSMIKKLNLNDRIFLKGNLPNKELLKEIRKHDIFLFTSDRHEGWGAVVNEAMSNACPVVGSDAVGSVPFLIKDGHNGLIFKSGNVDELTRKVEILIKDRNLRETMARNAYYTLHDVWSPANAAKRLLDLINCLQQGREFDSLEGPCSPAYPFINV